ncbi:LapA family protein [Moorella naiadis]|uniref:LapA family protein n=1 Tax=Moorella naiadis (nom. illeg.) TaxID=3093670 RepID=UPI003D9CBC56
MQIYSLLAILFALLVAIFAVQNAVAVNIRFLAWQFPEISLVLVILGAAAFGALVVFLLGLVRQVRASREIRQLRQENHRLAANLARLEQGTPAAAGSENPDIERKQEI